MANKWWRDTGGAPNDFNDVNYSLTETGSGGVAAPGAGDDQKLSDTAASSNGSLTANLSPDNVFMTSASSGGTDDFTGNYDISIYTLTTGQFILSGALIMAANGKITCSKFDGESASVSKGAVTQGATIECSGDWLCGNNQIWDVNRVDLKLTGNGFLYRHKLVNSLYQFEHATGAKHTVTATSYIANGGDGNCTLNGWFILNGIIVIRFDSTGITSLGAGFMISGTHPLNWACDQTRTLTVSSSIAEMAAWTEELHITHTNTNDQYALTLNIPNTDYKITGRGVAIDYQLLGNDLICKTLTFTNTLTGDMTIDNATENISITVKESVAFHAGVGVYATIYNKSNTAIFTLSDSGGTDTIDFNGKSIENLTINAVTSIKEIASNFTTATCTFSGGIVRSDVSGTQRIITVTNTSVAANTTFKDISMGSAARVNAKAATNTNQGNTLGIVFQDIFQSGMMGF